MADYRHLDPPGDDVAPDPLRDRLRAEAVRSLDGDAGDEYEAILILGPDEAAAFFDEPVYVETEDEGGAPSLRRGRGRASAAPPGTAFPVHLSEEIRRRAWADYAERLARARSAKAARGRRRVAPPSKARIFAEAVALLGALAGVNAAFFPDDPGFRRLELNPFFLPVVLLAVRYGTLWGAAAGLAAAGLLVLGGGRFDLEDGSLVLPGLLVAVGTMAGALSRGQGGRLAYYRARAEQLQANRAKILRALEAKNAVITELQGKIEEQGVSAETLYAYSRGMESEDDREMYRALLGLVARDLKADRAAVYEPCDGKLVLAASLDRRVGAERFKDELPPEAGLAGWAVRLNRVVSAFDKEVAELREPSFLAGPVREGDDIRAVVVVEEMPLLDFTPAMVSRFAGLLTWAAESRARASGGPGPEGPSLVAEDVGLFGPAFLAEALAKELARSRRHGTPLRVLLVRILEYEDLSEARRRTARLTVARALCAQTRETDTVCLTAREDTFAALLPMFEREDPSALSDRVTSVLDRVWAGSALVLSFSFADAGSLVPDAPAGEARAVRG